MQSKLLDHELVMEADFLLRTLGMIKTVSFQSSHDVKNLELLDVAN